MQPGPHVTGTQNNGQAFLGGEYKPAGAPGAVLDPSDGDPAFTGVKAAIHRNHGLLTASRHSIDACAFWFIALERCCRQQLMIDATGIQPTLVSPERARYSREHVGSEYIGWLHFQTLWEQIAAEQPDLFE